jgi:hypothetical protein
VVLGDRPDRSYDSRQHGYLAADRLMGVVVRPLRDRHPLGSPAVPDGRLGRML